MVASCSKGSVISVPLQNGTSVAVLAEEVEGMVKELQVEQGACPCSAAQSATTPRLRGSAGHMAGR